MIKSLHIKNTACLPCPWWKGIYDEGIIRGFGVQREYEGDPMEGYVVRLARGFHYREFPKALAKFVRAGHVQTQDHWMRSILVPNERRNEI